jgi:hypothetical protein
MLYFVVTWAVELTKFFTKFPIWRNSSKMKIQISGLKRLNKKAFQYCIHSQPNETAFGHHLLLKKELSI